VAIGASTQDLAPFTAPVLVPLDQSHAGGLDCARRRTAVSELVPGFPHRWTTVRTIRILVTET
jgi:hypothetical protein